MRNLADTIARLAALRGQQGAADYSFEPSRLQDLANFGSNPGALKARTFVPEGMLESAPLVVILHGCLQTAAAYDHGSGWSTLADKEGFALLYPEQQRANNPNKCFNWFQPDDTRRGVGEAASIYQMIEHMVSEHSLDRRRVYITGLSAGGAMAGAMLATYPEVFAGGAIIAGLPFGSARTMPEAFDRMRGHGGPNERQLGDLIRQATEHVGRWPTISVWHGSSDTIVAPSNARDIVSQWRAVHNLKVAPTRVEAVGFHQRRIWADGSGRDVIEEYTINGMGHGTPLDTGPGGCGAVGPYMLDAKISSTQRIARLWGLAPTASEKTTAQENTKLPAVTTPFLRYREVPRRGRSRSSEIPNDGIRKIIEDALRTAGLMT